MKVVNRGYILIRPKQPFVEWAKEQDAELFITDDSEPTVYLIEEDFFEDEQVLKSHFKAIFSAELEGVSENEEAFPEIKWETFNDWFEAELGTTVVDCLSTPLVSED